VSLLSYHLGVMRPTIEQNRAIDAYLDAIRTGMRLSDRSRVVRDLYRCGVTTIEFKAGIIYVGLDKIVAGQSPDEDRYTFYAGEMRLRSAHPHAAISSSTPRSVSPRSTARAKPRR